MGPCQIKLFTGLGRPATLHRPTGRLGGCGAGEVIGFPEGDLNTAYYCVDRWAFRHSNKVSPVLPYITSADLLQTAIYEGDEPGEGREVIYAELLRDVWASVTIEIRPGKYHFHLSPDDQSVVAFLASGHCDEPGMFFILFSIPRGPHQHMSNL